MTTSTPDLRPRRSALVPIAIAVAFACGVLATAGVAASRSEPTAAPASATARTSEAERIAADLAALRERNATAQAGLDASASDLDRVLAARETVGKDDATPTATATKHGRTKKHPRPHRPTEPTTTESKHRPIEIDNDRDPLAGITR